MRVTLGELLRAGRNWGHLSVRAAAYGTVSCVLGPLTPRKLASRWAMRRWCLGTCKAVGISRDLYGASLLDDDRQCVYVANHLSLIDILVLGTVLRKDYRWLAKESVFKAPFLGWHLRVAGHIPVYRGESRAKNKQLGERIHEVVSEGASLLFFPEGTRSVDGRLQKFRIGAFLAAAKEGLPIVPLVLRGTGELMEKGRIDMRVDASRTCSVTVLPPVEVPTLGGVGERARWLRNEVWHTMAASLGELPQVVQQEERSAVDARNPDPDLTYWAAQ